MGEKDKFLKSLKPIAFILSIGLICFGVYRFVAKNDPIGLGEDCLIGLGLGLVLYSFSQLKDNEKVSNEENEDE